MTTSRIRNYVKKNPDLIESWRKKVLHKHLVRVLTDKYGSDGEDGLKGTEDFNVHQITGHGGQDKICADILYDHFDLAYHVDKKHKNFRHISSGKSLHVSDVTFNKMIKDLAEKPEFPVVDTTKKFEDDIYTLAKNLSLENLVYIYQNQDEFCYIDKRSERRWSYHSRRALEGLGVFWKDQKEEADNIAFRNALDNYYEDKLNVIGKIVCGKDFPDLVEIDWSINDDSFEDSVLSDYHKSLFPLEIDDLSEEYLNKKIEKVEYGIEKIQRTLEQLKELRASILDAGGTEKFREKYYEKMLANFYMNLPLFINVKDNDLKSLAKRAMKRKFT